MNLLFLSNVSGNKMGSFSRASIQACKALNIHFHYAANLDAMPIEQRKKEETTAQIKLHHVPFTRTIFSKKNWQSFTAVKKIIQENNIQLIHCNTPIGGLVGRLVARNFPDVYVIYEAHGFHFYRGNRQIKQRIYKGVEKFLASYTDTLITMNEEDYQVSKTFRLRNHALRYWKVSGVGIELPSAEIIGDALKRQKSREILGIRAEQFVFVFLGDLIARKNIETAILAFKRAQVANTTLLICGIGPQLEPLKRCAGGNENIQFLGYQTDSTRIFLAADCLLFPSLQEGLPRTVMEAMSFGLPCIVSNVRGNDDLIDAKGGIRCTVKVVDDYQKAIKQMVQNQQNGKNKQLGRYNAEKVKNYSIETVQQQIQKIYQESLKSLSERARGINE